MQYTTSSENYSTSMKRDSPSRWGPKDDSKGYIYKKSSYQYSTNDNNNSSFTDANVDQLDSLLEDLRNERKISKDKELLSTSVNYRTIEQDKGDPSGMAGMTTTRIYKTSKSSGMKPEGVDSFSSDYNTIQSSGYHSLQKNVDYKTKGNVYENRNKIYESNHRMEDNSIAEIVPSITTTNLEKDLQNIALTEDILPLPGTKVTTTVRTYTYEVPSNSHNTLTTNSQYNTIQRNEMNNSTLPYSVPNVPQTVSYNTESYSTINRNPQPPVVSNQIYEIREHRETNTTKDHLAPQRPIPDDINRTIVYKYNTTENVSTLPDYNSPPSNIDRQPLSPNQYTKLPPNQTSRYFYKESSNVVNTIHKPSGPPEHGHPPHPQHSTLHLDSPPYGKDHFPHSPPNVSTVTSYKYSTTTRHPNDHLTPTSGQPAPFPVDGVDYGVNGNPPQRVDDLMQSFGNVNSVDRSDIETPYRKREIETAVASPNQQMIPTINKAGKEVYYPPGHEMVMTKREEMSAGSAAGGRWAKGSGMYEYESGYKSKTKTKSGGAMVPVCLPLCCAMPCSIM